MTNIIVSGIVLVIIGGAVYYIIKEKKMGARCIGCPMSGKCQGGNADKTTCSCQTKK